MSICFLFFTVGCGVIFYFQDKMHAEYIQQGISINKKQQIISNIYDQFNSNILIKPQSIVFIVPVSKEKVLDTERRVRQNLTELEPLIKTDEEKVIYQNIDNFTSYYFTNLIPLIMSEYNKTEDPSIDIQDSVIVLRVENFFEQGKLYGTLLEGKQTDIEAKLVENQANIQKAVILFFIFILILSFLVIRKIIRSIGKPLANFTTAANEIAAGRDAAIEIDHNRKDELGVLSVAFKKMMDSIQDKEQSLVAHNEELIAQQDELQAQQEILQGQATKLQNTLDILKDNEQKLKRWNQLVNHISTSLNKTEVLNSIIKNMCKITESDKGMLTFLRDHTCASYGISDFGVQQFRNHIDSGLIHRLNNEKKPFTVKRLQHPMEKGYHETSNYSFDLYLPIIISTELVGVMVLSRYGDAYSERELSAYETLVKQMAIYIEKVTMFEQSEDNRRLNQDILNTVQEGVQLIDANLNIIQVNQQFYKIFEWRETPEELIGLPWNQWSQIMAGQIQEQEFIKNLENLIQLSSQFPNEEHSFIYRINSSNQVIRVYSKTIEYLHEHVGTLFVHRDITKEYEIAQMKSEFVSTVSHELRTPLASVLGFTELLLTKELKPERKTKYLQTIYNESKRLTALINDFLDIQRMESGKQTYEKKFIDVTTIIQNVIELQEINTSFHHINLSIELKETIILGDKNKLKQVFMNLLNNAIKYSPEGGDISIKIYGDDQNISIDIKDEGLGIPEDAIPNLFQQFYRVDNSDRRKIGGTGLGLAIVQEIVKAHDGKITVSSIFKKGSTFTTNFPKVTLKANKEKVNGDKPSLNYTIMVIEDDLSLAELLNHELQEIGFQVDHQNNGQIALEKIKKEVPDAVVLDIMLADEITGWTIMKEMKANEKLKNIPIFVSTALEEKERGFSLGAENYLIKPYKPTQLSKLIKETLICNEKSGQIMMPH